MPFLAAAVPIISAITGAIGTAATAIAVGVETAALAVGVSGATALTIGAGVEALVPVAIEFGASAALSALLSPRPAVNTAGSPQRFKSDPLAPVPMVMGRYGVGGNLIYETTSGGASKAEHGAAGNEYLTQFVILAGLGPYPGLETTRLDSTVLTFGGESCTGGYIEGAYVQQYNPGYQQNPNGSYQNNTYKDHYWQVFNAGSPYNGDAAVLKYPSKIAGAGDNLPEWDQGHGVAGHAAVVCTRSFDTTTWAGGVGEPQWVLSGGYPVWDPRKDSTHPGGNGPQRPVDQSTTDANTANINRQTWAPSSNPIIHALNYAIGHYLPSADGRGIARFAGIGAGVAGVDVDAFVRAANVADANNWNVTGQWTTGDGKRSVLTAMLQTGGAQLVSDKGRISCMVSTPLVAINASNPLTWDDLAGPVSLDATTSIRDRYNTAFVKYTSEPHRWQLVQADSAVLAETYVAEDGQVVKSRTLEFPFCPSVDQASQLAAYALADGREISNIVLPGKPHLRGYRVGDCIEVDLPELGLHTTKLVVTKRKTEPSDATVTLTCRTETDAKHPFALGVSGVAPPTPGISGFDPTIVPVSIPGSWPATPTTIRDPSGETTHIIRIDGLIIDNVYAADVIVTYAQVTTVNGGDVEGPQSTITFPASQTVCDLYLSAGRWHVWVRYRTIHGAENVDNTLDLGIITIDPSTAGLAAAITVDTVIKDRDLLVSDLLKQIDDVQAGLAAISDADLGDALQALDAATAFSANLILNPDFSVKSASGALTDWTLAGGWAAGTDLKMGGSGSALLNTGTATDTTWSTPFAVLPGNKYSLQALERGTLDANGRIRVTVDWLDANKASLNDAVAMDFAPTDGPTRATSPGITSPDAAAFCRVGVSLFGAGSDSGVSVTRLKFELGAVCTPFSNEGAQAYQSQVTQFITGTDYAKSTDYRALYAQVNTGDASIVAEIAMLNQATADLSTGKASAQSVTDINAYLSGSGLTGRITNVLSAEIDQPGGIASVSSVQNITAGIKAPNPNICPDSTFALTLAGATGAWPLNGPIANQSGTGNRLITQNNGSYNCNSPTVPASPNTPYVLSGRMTRYTAGGSCQLQAVWTNNGSVVRVDSLDAPVDGGSPGQLSSVALTSPSNCNGVYVQWLGSVPSGGLNHQLFQPKLEPGTAVTAYIPDGVTPVNLSASVKTAATAAAQANGYLAASYAINVNANGVATAFTILAGGTRTQPLSAVKFSADVFSVVGSSGANMTFTDAGGGVLSVNNLVVKTANIGYAAIGTSNLGGGAVTGLNVSLGVTGLLPSNGASNPPSGGGGTGGTTNPGNPRTATP